MTEQRIKELEDLLSKLLLIMLPKLKVHKQISESEFEIIFGYLEELKELMSGKEYISRSLVSKLFHLYYSTSKEFSFISDSEQGNRILSKLTMYLASIFNDSYFK